MKKRISKWTNFQSHTPKYCKAHQFKNCSFHKFLYGEQARFAHFENFAIQNLIKTTCFKLMVLHNTLVYDSDKWSTYYFWFALSSGVFYFCLAKFYRSCHVHDKGRVCHSRSWARIRLTVHGRSWSWVVGHGQTRSAMVGHAGRPWSVTISHEHDSRKHATFPIFYGRDPERTSCTQNDQVWEGSLSTTKPDVLNPTRHRVMFEYVYVALKYPGINCVVTVRRLFYSRETIGREVWWRVTFPISKMAVSTERFETKQMLLYMWN